MDYEKKYKEVFNMNKADLLYLIENLIVEGKLDISDIAISHTKALERKLAAKDEIIHQADNCIFESVFTDSIGKPADDASLQRKLEWLDKIGTHNMEGIFKYLKIMDNSEPKIVDINESIPHKVSEVICVKCAYRWLAVRSVATLLKELECPWCGKQGFVIETGEIINENK